MCNENRDNTNNESRKSDYFREERERILKNMNNTSQQFQDKIDDIENFCKEHGINI